MEGLEEDRRREDRIRDDASLREAIFRERRGEREREISRVCGFREVVTLYNAETKSYFVCFIFASILFLFCIFVHFTVCLVN